MGRLLDRINKQSNSNCRPCPICGAQPECKSDTYDPWGDGGGTITDYWYECSGCGTIKGGVFCDDNYKVSKQTALQDWNETVDDFNKIFIRKENVK